MQKYVYHGPCSRDRKSATVNTGRKRGRKIWSPVFTGRGHGSCE